MKVRQTKYVIRIDPVMERALVEPYVMFLYIRSICNSVQTLRPVRFIRKRSR